MSVSRPTEFNWLFSFAPVFQWCCLTTHTASILHKSIAGRYRPVRVADGPITARCRFIKNDSWAGISSCLNTLFPLSPHLCFILDFICDLSFARNVSWMS